MARVLGLGGLANTNGARDFSAKEVADVAPVVVNRNRGRRRMVAMRRLMWILTVLGV